MGKESNQVAINIIMGDVEGNIAYIAASETPRRKNPFAGAFVSRGWVAENEWDQGVISNAETPFVINPPKGYIVTANNRVTSTNTRVNVAVSHVGKARALRITEMIEERISNGRKFNLEEMKAMQEDMIDVYAREKKKGMIAIARREFGSLRKSVEAWEIAQAERMLHALEEWDSNFQGKSVEATVFATWEWRYMLSLFKEQITDEDARLYAYNYYGSEDFLLNLFENLERD